MKFCYIFLVLIGLGQVSFSQTYQDYYNRGLKKEAKQDYVGAILDFNKSILLNPKFSKAHYNRGVAKYYSNDYTGAVMDFTKAIELNLNIAPDGYYIMRSRAKNALFDRVGAMSDLNTAISLYPLSSNAYIGRGNLKGVYLGDHLGAISDYDQVIRIDPKNGLAYNCRGSAKESLEDYVGALNDYTKAIDLRSDVGVFYYDRGKLLIIYLNDKVRGCLDLSKSGELGYEDAYDEIKHFCL